MERAGRKATKGEAYNMFRTSYIACRRENEDNEECQTDFRPKYSGIIKYDKDKKEPYILGNKKDEFESFINKFSELLDNGHIEIKDRGDGNYIITVYDDTNIYTDEKMKPKKSVKKPTKYDRPGRPKGVKNKPKNKPEEQSGGYYYF